MHITVANCARSLRFGLRNLLLFIVVACVASNWLGGKLNRVWTQRQVLAEIEKAGGKAHYDYQPRGELSREPPPGSPLIRSVLGNDVFASVSAVFFENPGTTNEDVACLCELTDLHFVRLCGTRVTDDCVPHLLRIKHLTGLSLSNTAISPAGLSRLSGHVELRGLTLEGPSFGDDYARQLKHFIRLSDLRLVSTAITNKGLQIISEAGPMIQAVEICFGQNISDDGIIALKGLPKVSSIRIYDVAVTPIAVSNLKDALPNCEVGFMAISKDK